MCVQSVQQVALVHAQVGMHAISLCDWPFTDFPNCARVSVQLSRSHRVRPRSMNFQAKAQLLGAARTSDGGVNLSQGTQIDVVIKSLREKLESENGVMNAFHALDVDNSNSLTIDEFGECLKSIGITLPKTHLSAVIARFDANGAHLHTSQPCCSDYCSDPAFSRFILAARRRQRVHSGICSFHAGPAGPQGGVEVRAGRRGGRASRASLSVEYRKGCGATCSAASGRGGGAC